MSISLTVFLKNLNFLLMELNTNMSKGKFKLNNIDYLRHRMLYFRNLENETPWEKSKKRGIPTYPNI